MGYGEGSSMVTNVLGGISVVCVFLVVVTFLIFRELRSFPITLILNLCGCIFFGNILFLAQNAGEFADAAGSCSASAGAMHYFFLAQFCWNLCVGFNFYQLMVRSHPSVSDFAKFYYAFAYGFPLACVVAVGASGSYGVLSGAFCWITDGVAQLLGFFFPVLVMLTTNSCIFISVAASIYLTVHSSVHSERSSKWRELRIYAFIALSLGLGWVFLFLAVLFPNSTGLSQLFDILGVILTSAEGILIFISYCGKGNVPRYWAAFFWRVRTEGFSGLQPPARGWSSIVTAHTATTSRNTQS